MAAARELHYNLKCQNIIIPSLHISSLVLYCPSIVFLKGGSPFLRQCVRPGRVYDRLEIK